MLNLKLASMLTVIAEINKFRKGETDKVINLSKAARSVRDYIEDISGPFYSGTLQQLPGIDNYSYNLIKEYFEKGKITEFEEIQRKYSEKLIKIIRLSGLGAERVFDIYSKIGITTYRELKEFFGNFSDLGEISVKKQIQQNYLERIKFCLDYFESIKGYYPAWQAGLCLEKILNKLSTYKELKKIRVTGSMRRRKSFVSDVDIILLPVFNNEQLNLEHTNNLAKKIEREPFIKEKKSEIIKERNAGFKFSTFFDIDLEIIISTENSFTQDLLTTTGSRRHQKEFRDYVIKRGMFDHKTDSFILHNRSAINKDYQNSALLVSEDDNYICQEEKELYEQLGLQYIPPELREGREEIELAEKKELPVLLKLEDIKGDLHVHSHWSDGIMDMSHIIKSARELNYEFLSFSDHSVSNRFGNGIEIKDLALKKKYIEKLNQENKGFRFLMGAEIEIDAEGRLDYPDEIIAGFDISLASIHSGFKFDSKTNTSRFVKALSNKNIDIIAHPTGTVFGSRAPYFMDIDEVIDAAVKNGKALEINSYYLRLDLNEENALKAKRAGAFLAINTDSHRVNNLFMIRLGVNIARKAGIEKKDVLNTSSYEEIKKWKKNR